MSALVSKNIAIPPCAFILIHSLLFYDTTLHKPMGAALNLIQPFYQPVTETGGFRRGFMFVLSSPSGAGKTTLSRRLLAQEHDIRMSVSMTTRSPRPGEVEGVDYFFTSQAEFDQHVAQDELLEHATVFNHSYGTPAAFVSHSLEAGIDILFDIDWQGTKQLAKQCRNDLVSVFILPPSMKELEARLRNRAQDSDETVRFRMERAAHEISHWQDYDYVVVNRDLDATLARITDILYAERRRCQRQTSLHQFVDHLFAEAKAIGY
jgi:guanylate kinase